MKLALTFRTFHHGVTDGRPPRSPVGLVGDERLNAADRLGIYRHAYMARLVGALRDLFPHVADALGDDFDAVAEAWLRENPPSSTTGTACFPELPPSVDQRDAHGGPRERTRRGQTAEPAPDDDDVGLGHGDLWGWGRAPPGRPAKGYSSAVAQASPSHAACSVAACLGAPQPATPPQPFVAAGLASAVAAWVGALAHPLAPPQPLAAAGAWPHPLAPPQPLAPPAGVPFRDAGRPAADAAVAPRRIAPMARETSSLRFITPPPR